MPQRDYSKAIELLNSLQSNAQTIAKMNHKANALTSLPEMRQYLQRIGYTPKDLSKLAFIHVAGTKGKGSTCAFAASILNQFTINGRHLKTGLYTSPHLVEVRERIRINGEPISKDKFAKYFFNVWDKLELTKNEQQSHRPAYFRYMTLLSFHAFMEEKCDAVVLEVGIGGQYDCTNVIETPVVTGISSLGIDHVSILGNTIEEIAWHKAGIMKEKCFSISVPQPEGAESVLAKRAQEINPSSFRILENKEIDLFSEKILGLAGNHQKINAALATVLVKEWIRLKRLSGIEISPENLSYDDDDAINAGLKDAKWPGRCQILQSPRFPGVTWYLDGAHTSESLEVCSSWFVSKVQKNTTNALIFNCTRQRHGRSLFASLLKELGEKKICFQRVIFTSNDPFSEQNSQELVNRMVDPDPFQKAQHELKSIFLEMAAENGLLLESLDDVSVVKSVNDALVLASDCDHVLITGSLHLVGSALSVFSQTN